MKKLAAHSEIMKKPLLYRGAIARTGRKVQKEAPEYEYFSDFCFSRICLKRFPFRVAPVPRRGIESTERACAYASDLRACFRQCFPRRPPLSNRRAAKRGRENNYCIKMHINLKLLHISAPKGSTFPHTVSTQCEGDKRRYDYKTEYSFHIYLVLAEIDYFGFGVRKPNFIESPKLTF